MMIYIHVPFCRRKCNYCAFNSVVSGAAQRVDYVDALIKEIHLRGRFEAVETIYFGGGTPTTLTLAQLEKILSAVRKNFYVDNRVEITIEANPCTVDENYLRGLQTLGFNRISLGVQSFNDALLKILGRIHTSRVATDTVALAKNFFDNVSLDLMYGLPNQTLEDVRRDIEHVKALDVEHVSIYGLEVEEDTKFFELARAGNLPLPAENICADMYDYITQTLPALNWRRYEVSNFAKKNFESRHNRGYWTGKKYFGFGAGAHSFNGNLRTSNVRDVPTYIKRICAGESVSTVEEVVTRREAMEEFCFLGLRLVEGIDARTFAENFGASIFDMFGAVISKNQRLGLLDVDGDRIFLTARGMSLGNEVFAEFLLT
ncbi:MAG: radical SAM family heme chaperone HemW [Selenomonadaceae bacterium]|nr:radical SAM family heme chaperone HemW [Selenomonadaceae bacterium]